jgi:PAS domain S-box-containing protein
MQSEDLPGKEGADAANASGHSAVSLRQEAVISAFINHFPGVIARIDRDLRHLYVSQQIESRTGLKPEAFIGRTWRDLAMPSGLIAQWELVFKQVLATGAPANLEFAMDSPMGVLYYDVRLFPEFDAAGAVESVFSMSLDVTEKVRAERQRSESEERFRLAFESCPIGMVLTNDTFKYIKANAAFCEMLGYTQEELAQLTPLDIIYAEDLIEGRELSIRLMAGELTSYTRNKRYIAKDGRLIWTRATTTVLRNADGHALFGLGMIEDIRESLAQEAELARNREQLEDLLRSRTQALHESQKSLRLAERLASIGTLAGGIVHEINNPIGAILLGVETAQHALSVGDADALTRTLKSIQEDAIRTGRIVKNVLSFVREQTIDKTRASLNDVTRKAVERRKSAAELHGAKLILELADRDACLELNTTAIEQAIGNVVQNAIESGGAEVVVRIATEFSDDYCSVVITDNGCGIPAEMQGEVFEPFFTTRRDCGGVGLGLSLVRSAVHDHQGRIDIDSEPGRGTRISIVLPTAYKPT